MTGNIFAMNDDVLINDFLARSSAQVENMITRALQRGERLPELALLLERRFDGRSVAACGTRVKMTEQFGRHPLLNADQRALVAERLGSIPPSELPVVILLDEGEGLILVAVRTVTGSVVGVG